MCSLLNVLLLVASAGMVAVYILALWQGGWQIQGLAVNPMVGPSAEALTRLGSKVSSKMTDQNQWWRLVTSLFVSSGMPPAESVSPLMFERHKKRHARDHCDATKRSF